MSEKFLILDVRDEPERTYVFHTERPRFLLECPSADEGEFIAIDTISDADRKALRQEAREFFDEG